MYSRVSGDVAKPGKAARTNCSKAVSFVVAGEAKPYPSLAEWKRSRRTDWSKWPLRMSSAGRSGDEVSVYRESVTEGCVVRNGDGEVVCSNDLGDGGFASFLDGRSVESAARNSALASR
jgi:hypothetical protein